MPPPSFSFSRYGEFAEGRWTRHFVISMLAIAVAIAGSALAGHFVPRGPRAALEGARASMDYHALEREYTKLVDADVYNLEYHRGCLDAHLAIPKEIHTRHSTIVRDDKPIQDRYDGYIRSSEARLRDIGLYGMGYFYAVEKQADKALEYYDKVGNRDLPYLNNSIGYLYLSEKHRPDLARPFFEREIAVKGNVDGAVANLAKLYWETRQLREMDALSVDATLGKYVPLTYLRYLELAEKRFGDYLVSLCLSEAGSVTWMSVLTSLVIALVFLGYTYFVDVFEKERLSLLVAVFGMGILSGVLATIFYDLAGAYGGFQQTGRSLHDLWFFIFGVGLFEETAKAAPVLITVFVWKKWNESVDIFIFAAVSALGFACIENMGYFSRVAIGLIMGRAISAVVMHVCLTSLAVYGLFYRRYMRNSRGNFYVFACFGAAVVAHGLYDFFISSVPGMGILSVLILVYMMIMFRNMIENALDQSEFIKDSPTTVNLSLYLFYGILGILLMQFSILSVRYGLDLSMTNMELNVLKFYFLCIVLIADFGYLKVVRHKWRSLLSRRQD